MSQVAEKKFPHAMLLGGLSVNLNHLKSDPLYHTPFQMGPLVNSVLLCYYCLEI